MPRTTGLAPNLAAFLDTIAASELGAAVIAESDDGYDVLVGSLPGRVLTFSSYAMHPNRLNNDISPPSDAAGRYQFLHRYWSAYQVQLHLADFGPLSQDIWCAQYIRECHALDLVLAGNFQEALFACRSRWASLPGSPYGQHTQTLVDLEEVYRAAGGSVA